MPYPGFQMLGSALKSGVRGLRTGLLGGMQFGRGANALRMEGVMSPGLRAATAAREVGVGVGSDLRRIGVAARRTAGSTYGAARAGVANRWQSATPMQRRLTVGLGIGAGALAGNRMYLRWQRSRYGGLPPAY